MISPVIDESGSYVFEVSVSDGYDTSTQTLATITGVNLPPVADAGETQRALPGEQVFLDGSGSSDPNGDTLSYQWSGYFGGADLIGADTATPSFIATGFGDYFISLRVTDPDGLSSTDQVVVVVPNVAPVISVAPYEANTVVGPDGTITLDASGTTDANGQNLSFQWSTWRTPNESTLDFYLGTDSTQRITFDAEGRFDFKIEVSDGETTVSEIIGPIYARLGNRSPDADIATPDGDRADERQILRLDGSGSTDPDSDSLTYSWNQIFGPTAVIASPTSAETEITLPDVNEDQAIEVELTVSDGERSNTTSVVLFTKNITMTPVIEDLWLGDTLSLDFDSVVGATFALDSPAFRTGMSGVRELPDGTTQIFGFEHPFSKGFVDGFSLDLFDLPLEDLSRSVPLLDLPVPPVLPINLKFGFMSDAQRKMRVFEYSGNVPMGVDQIYEVELPDIQDICFVATRPLSGAIDNIARYDLILGRKGSGMSHIPRRFENGAEVLLDPISITETGSICNFIFTRIKSLYDEQAILAFDQSSSSIRTFHREFSSPSSYEEGETTPILSPPGLSVLRTVIVTGSYFPGVSYDDNLNLLNSIFVLQGDGQHDGNHLLQLYRQENYETDQKFELVSSANLDKGIPKSIVVMDLVGDVNPEIYVIFESIPFIARIPVVGDFADWSLGSPEYLEVGFDILGIQQFVENGRQGEPYTLVTSPKNNEMIYLMGTK